jgi:hypothetical protein
MITSIRHSLIVSGVLTAHPGSGGETLAFPFGARVSPSLCHKPVAVSENQHKNLC